MNTPDAINGCLEFLAGFMILNHCRVVLRERVVAGVSIVSTIFFSAWGIWNLWYYPHLGQMLSFYGGLLIVIANCLWVGLMIRFKQPIQSCKLCL